MQQTVNQLVVHRQDPARHELRTTTLAEPKLGEALVRVELFGLSANNVTYAALGEQLSYSNFFPVDASWSALPVWGVGEVIGGNAESAPVGTRLFGYFPAASHALLTLGEASPLGLRAERPGMSAQMSLYNQYTVAGQDRLYLPDREDWMVVLRPLFLTGILLADYLQVRERFGAEVIAISSAASKTSYGLALALRQLGEGQLVGLASPGSSAAAAARDVYDRVVRYDELASLDRTQSIVHVDVAGSPSVRAGLRDRLGPKMKQVISVGLTHWKDGGYGPEAAREGTPAEVFFAPGWMNERARKAGREFHARIGQSWFAQVEAAQKKLTIEREAGASAVAAAFARLVEGDLDPDRAWVGSF